MTMGISKNNDIIYEQPLSVCAPCVLWQRASVAGRIGDIRTRPLTPSATAHQLTKKMQKTNIPAFSSYLGLSNHPKLL